MHNIGLYLRVSTLEQSRLIEGSLASQRQRLDNYVAYRNSEVPNWGRVVGVYQDEAKSGGHLNRLKLTKLIQKIRRQEIDTVIVTELSRISRSVQDFCFIWDLMKSKGVCLISLREQFDTESAAGEMILFSLISFAQFERKQTAERVSANFRARAERGLFNGGLAPLGFDIDPSRRGYLIINQNEAERVKLIFKYFEMTGTLRGTLAKVRADGIKPKSRVRDRNAHNYREFKLEGIWRILRNPCYIGRREINRRFRFKQAQVELNEDRTYRTTKAMWPAILSDEEFERVQRELDANRFRFKSTREGRFDYTPHLQIETKIF